jgi:hypothetical protein
MPLLRAKNSVYHLFDADYRRLLIHQTSQKKPLSYRICLQYPRPCKSNSRSTASIHPFQTYYDLERTIYYTFHNLVHTKTPNFAARYHLYPIQYIQPQKNPVSSDTNRPNLSQQGKESFGKDEVNICSICGAVGSGRFRRDSGKIMPWRADGAATVWILRYVGGNPIVAWHIG